MTKSRKAVLYALVAVLCWSTAGTAFKLTLQHLDVPHMLLFSSGVAMLAIALFLSFEGQWDEIFKSKIKDILHSALLGFLNPFLYYLVLLSAYNILLAQEALVLNYTWPVVLVLLSIPFLKQRPGIKGLAAIFISFAGTFVVITHGNFKVIQFSEPSGVILAASSALIWGCFWIFNARDKRGELSKLFLNFVFGFLYTLIYIILRNNYSPVNLPGFLGSVYIGLFEMGITFVLWLRALQLSPSTAKVTNLIYLSPFVSLILLGIIVGEKIYPATVSGLLLITIGIIIQQRSDKH